MDRIQLINTLVRLRGYRDYLEIGVKGGEAFRASQVECRTGVDPDLRRLKPGLQPGLRGKVKRWIRQPLALPWSSKAKACACSKCPATTTSPAMTIATT